MSILEKYNKLEQELHSLVTDKTFNSTRSLKLERIALLLERLDNPQNDYKTIHVGGTAGKGSTATMIANILQAHGHKVALHTSPHLQILNERHVVNGRPLATTVLCRLWEKIKPHITWMKEHSPYGPPTYFEIQTTLSFLAFKDAQVDYAVIEVGLGGTLDATNVITPVLSVLTNVDLDHTEILGDTVEKIATDKAGIIKRGVPVITGANQPEVIDIFKTRAIQNHSDCFILNEDFFVPHDMSLSLYGEKQLENAALAICGTTIVLGESYDKERAFQALQDTTLPARIEVIQKKPTVILDGAHNPAKVSASLTSIRELAGDKQVQVLLAVKAGKDSVGILEPILSISQHIVCTNFTQALWNSVEVEDLRTQILHVNPEVEVISDTDPMHALHALLENSNTDDLIWVVGSLYLAGELREHWLPKEQLLLELE